jgi:uncharacterized DUF497 family protein
MFGDAFTFDPDKDSRNVLKHGMPLRNGVAVFESPNKLTLISARTDEERLMDIAKVGMQVRVLVYVVRSAQILSLIHI